MRRFRASSLPGSEDWVFVYTADDERIMSKRGSYFSNFPWRIFNVRGGGASPSAVSQALWQF